MAEQQVSINATQLEQAIKRVSWAIDWSDPPESDVSHGQQVRLNDASFQLIVACARKAMLQANEPELAPSSEPVLAEIATNGAQ